MESGALGVRNTDGVVRLIQNAGEATYAKSIDTDCLMNAWGIHGYGHFRRAVLANFFDGNPVKDFNGLLEYVTSHTPNHMLTEIRASKLDPNDLPVLGDIVK